MATLDKKVTNLIKHWETKSPQNKSSASSVRLQSLSTQFEFGNHKQNDFSHLQRNLTMGNLNITLQKPVIDTTSQLKSTVFDGLSTQILIETPIRQKIYTHKYVPSNATFVKFASPSSVATTGSSSSKFRHLESSVFSTSVTSTEKRVWSSNTPSPVVRAWHSRILLHLVTILFFFVWNSSRGYKAQLPGYYIVESYHQRSCRDGNTVIRARSA